MSAKDAQESVITLPEWVGVITDLQQKCTGKRPRLWFNAFKRFLKKEEAWIKTGKIVWVPRAYGKLNSALDSFMLLKSKGLNFLDYWDEVFATDSKVQFEEIPYGYDTVPPHDLVSVRVGDLLNPVECKTLTYDQIIQKAYEEHDLTLCDLRGGLNALEELLQRAKMERFASTSNHDVLCIKPITSFAKRTVPVFRLYKGNHEEPGSIFLRDVDLVSDPEKNPGRHVVINDYLTPDSRLIFRQIAT